MYEALNIVNRYDRDIVLIFIQKLRARVDIDLLENKFFAASSALDNLFCLVAEMTTGARIDDYFKLRHYTSCQPIEKLGINSAADHIIFCFSLGAALFMFKLIIRFTAQRGIPVLGVIV